MLQARQQLFPTPLQRLNDQLVWNKKLRIALLALLTFIAMC